jgi:ferric-dicitrate binding protein FerR (iron transport regulator)
MDLVAQNEFISQQLADSSLIVLSPNSKVETSIGDERRIKLSGKAYFEVTPDKAHPFVVETEQVIVTVLGTAFNVEETDTGVRTEVREGKVRMEIEGEAIELSIGDVGIYDKGSGSLEIEVSENVQTWGDRTIVFSGTPLGEVVEHLQIFYSVSIVLANEELANCRLTATFADEQIGDVLSVIASTFDLELKEISSNAFELDGEGC